MLHLGILRVIVLSQLFLLAGVWRAEAQVCDYEVRGLVEDENGEVLAGATVYFPSLERGAASDETGKFVIDNLCGGNYQLVIKYVGYEDQKISIRIPVSRSLVIKLRTSAHILHDITVKSQHAQKHSLTHALDALTEEELESYRGRPIGDLVQRIPGVQSITTGGALFKPVIHGLYGQRLLILNNGLRQEGQQWGLEHAPEIDSYIASEIEVVKGSESVRYGSDAMGGAIMINAQPLHYSTSVGAELNTSFSSNNRMGAFSGMLEGGITDNVGWRVQGTMKKGGDFHSPDYNLTNTGAEELNFSATAGYEKPGTRFELYGSTFNTTVGILRSSHVGNLTDLQKAITSGKPAVVEEFSYDIANPRQSISHHLVRASAEFELNGGKELTFLYGFQYDRRREYDVPRSQRKENYFSVELFAQSLDITLDHDNGPWSGSIGLAGSFKDNFNERGTTLLPDYRQANGAVFVIEKHRKNRWLLEGGARFDIQRYEAWLYEQSILIRRSFLLSYFSVAAGASIPLGNNGKFSTNLSVAERPPHMSELFSRGLHHSAASIENGLLVPGGQLNPNDQDLIKERSHQWVNTFHFSKKGLAVEASVYANYFKDYIFLSPTGSMLTIRGYFPVFGYSQTDAFLAGGDGFISFDFTRALGWTSKFSYVWAEDVDDGNRLPFIAPAQTDHGLTFRRSSLGKWSNFFATMAMQVVLEQTHAPRTIYPADVAANEITETFDFMPAPKAYALLRLELGAKLPLDNRDFSVGFVIENLTNTSYRNYLSRLRYYADEPGLNFSIRLNYKFHSHE